MCCSMITLEQWSASDLHNLVYLICYLFNADDLKIFKHMFVFLLVPFMRIFMLFHITSFVPVEIGF